VRAGAREDISFSRGGNGLRGLEQIPWLYDLGQSWLERGWLGRERRWLVAGTRGRTLELGAGTGRNLPLYAAGQLVFALEPYAGNVGAARARAPSVPHLRGRAEALPFADASFDTVVSGLVFCSVDDPAAGLAEIRRVLRPGGRLRMLEHVRAESPLWARAQDLGQPGWTWLTGGCRPNRDTERSVRAAGFEIDPASRVRRGTFVRFEARSPF
jgi:SAM-dependent methyltransferase